jgi:Tfp pilus assembly protein FimT
MSTIVETQSDQERRSLYIGVGVVFAVLALIALLMFKAGSTTQAAEDKAAQLTTELQAAGARAPSSAVLVRLFGDDGGAVCADPNAALSKATLLSQLSTGASGPGARPIIADNRAVQGQLAIMKVYCPDELADFQEFVDDLKLDDSVAGS